MQTYTLSRVNKITRDLSTYQDAYTMQSAAAFVRQFITDLRRQDVFGEDSRFYLAPAGHILPSHRWKGDRWQEIQ